MNIYIREQLPTARLAYTQVQELVGITAEEREGRAREGACAEPGRRCPHGVDVG